MEQADVIGALGDPRARALLESPLLARGAEAVRLRPRPAPCVPARPRRCSGVGSGLPGAALPGVRALSALGKANRCCELAGAADTALILPVAGVRLSGERETPARLAS